MPCTVLAEPGPRICYVAPTTPSPSQLLASLAPLLHAARPVLAERVRSPSPPGCLTSPTVSALLSLDAPSVAQLERNPSSIASFLCTRYPSDPLFQTLHTASHGLLATCFPMRPAPPHVPIVPGGGSLRKSKARPRPTKAAQIRHVAELLQHIVHASSDIGRRIVDVGAGHGHLCTYLTRQSFFDGFDIVGVERDPALAGRDKPYSSVCADVLSDSADTLFNAGDVVVGLHPCGRLGDVLLARACASAASGILVVSCCLQKVGDCDTRHPLSAAGTKTGALALPRDLLGATNTTRGYAGREGLLTARRTRHALRGVLAELGSNDDAFVSRHKMKKGLSAVLPDFLDAYGVEDETVRNSFVAQCSHREARAADEYEAMRRLALPRAFAAAAFEVALVLDRAAYIEEAGFNVYTCRLWPDDLSARNLTIAGWR